MALNSQSTHSRISRIELVKLAFSNMKAKKTRTLVTVGGMAIGIGAIVFLVSIGYGLQELVTQRVARLEELRQINIFPQQGSNVKLNEKTLSDLKGIPEVKQNLPLISLVGQINYEDSTTDVVVYGVTSDYLRQSAIQPSKGKIFKSNDIKLTNDSTSYNGSNQSSKVLASVLGAQTVNQSLDSNEGVTDTGQVAGENIDFVELNTESQKTKNEKVEIVKLDSNAKHEAVVNRALLQMLNLSETRAIGKTFEVTFVVVGNLLNDSEKKVQSTPVKYTITGVIPEEKTAFFYVPFIDIRTLGVSNYSQIKTVISDPAKLNKVREQIEAKGYSTTSVVDTIDRIGGLFAMARVILILVGLVALSIAALGMLNTLTVSLLERTKEVGFMKTIGMKSDEVNELFLAESLVMGLSGGVLGLGLGYAVGQLLSMAISVFSTSRGGGALHVSSIPLSLTLAVLFLSLVVGIITGYYPARRATKISALDALRYE